MSTRPDHLKKYIKEILLPILGEDGFKLYRPKDFVRVKGPFVDRISFQLSQYGSKNFFVHYYKNLISDPLVDIDSYRVGNRLMNNSENGDDTKWCGAHDAEAQDAIASVSHAYSETIRPWFESLESVPEYFFEYFANNRDATLNSMEIVIAFAEGSKRERSWWLCSDMVESQTTTNQAVLAACQMYLNSHEAEAFNEALKNDRYAATRDAFAGLSLPETDHQTIDALLGYWRQTNLEKFRLEKFIV